MGSYHLWDYDWTPLSQNPCWNHTTILSLRVALRISCKNTSIVRLKASKLYGTEWNGSVIAIVCRRLKVKEGLYEYELACSSESMRFSLSFWLKIVFTYKIFWGWILGGSIWGEWPGFENLRGLGEKFGLGEDDEFFGVMTKFWRIWRISAEFLTVSISISTWCWCWCWCWCLGSGLDLIWYDIHIHSDQWEEDQSFTIIRVQSRLSTLVTFINNEWLNGWRENESNKVDSFR